MHGAVVDVTYKVATHTTVVAGKIRQTFAGSPEKGASEKASLLSPNVANSSPRTDAGTFNRPYEGDSSA
jgi:hypothetical protein